MPKPFDYKCIGVIYTYGQIVKHCSYANAIIYNLKRF